MHVPEIHEQRKKISGLQMPRRYSPRLPGASTKGQAPINPFGANKMKVASLSDVRRHQLGRHALKTASLTEELAFHEAQAEYEQFVKTASMREYSIFLDLQKVAESVESPNEFWEYCVRQYGDEIEKNAGINAAIGAAAKFLSKGLSYGAKATGSKALSRGASNMAARSSKAYGRAATQAEGRVVAMEEGLRKGSGGRLTEEMGKVDKYSTQAQRQASHANRHSVAGKIPDPPAAGADAASKGMSFGTKAKIVGGVGVAGGLVGTGMLTNKIDRIGKQENVMQSQRGFNYGMR